MAHSFNLNEPIVTALANQLSAQLPNAIAAVNADVTDGYTIVNPTYIHNHIPLLSTIAGAGFPAIGVEDAGSQIVDDLVSSATGVHRLTIVAFVSNPHPQALAWQLRRYQQAVLLALQVDRTLGGVAWTTRILGVQPGPWLQPAEQLSDMPENTFVSWVAIDIETLREEV